MVVAIRRASGRFRSMALDWKGFPGRHFFSTGPAFVPGKDSSQPEFRGLMDVRGTEP